ncbi:MAG: hypothetical protein AAF481_05440 [Acidobacteriota bacterium]
MPNLSRTAWIPTFALWALGLLVVAGYFASEWMLLSGEVGFPLDDTWIHLTFAENLAAGFGLSYNPGEPVAGSTSPLWTALLALLTLLPGHPVLWPTVAAIFFHLASLSATVRLAHRHGVGQVAAWVAGALVALTSWMAWSALSGMEICLFTFLSVAGMARHARERLEPDLPPLAFAVLALAAMARPEGFLLLLLAAFDRSFELPTSDSSARLRWPGGPILGGLLPALVALAPALLALRWVGGQALPTTFGAKVEPDHWLPSTAYLDTVFGILFRPQPAMTVLALVGTALLFERVAGRRHPGLLPGLWWIALPLAYSVLSASGRPLVGNFGRYFFPLFPVAAVLAVLAGERLAKRVGPALHLGRLAIPLRALLAALLLIPTLGALAQGAGRFAQNVANVRDGDLTLAAWVRAEVHPDAVLAVQDIGAFGFFTPNRLVDLAGIATPEVQRAVRSARGPADPIGRAGMESFLERQRPDLLLVFDTWFRVLEDRPEEFPVLFVVEVPGNITLGSDRIVVATTPWTRPEIFLRRATPSTPSSGATPPEPLN